MMCENAYTIGKKLRTRIHSSRMRTARSLTIKWGGGAGWGLPRGVPAQGGVCPGRCLPSGGRGAPTQWGYHHHPVERQKLVKTQPSQTMFAGGNNPVSQKRNNTVTEFLAGRKGHIHCPRLEILISIGIVATTVYHWSTQYCYRSCNRNKMKKMNLFFPDS